jgi:exosortase/archaeosortase family protein
LLTTRFRGQQEGPDRYRRQAALVFLAALFLLFPLTTRFSVFWLHGFSLPAAVLAAPFLGVPCAMEPDACVLANPHRPVRVTSACSAAGFFVLLVSLFAAMVVSGPASRRAWLVAVVSPAAYAGAVAANAARIVLVWWADMAAAVWLPPAMGPGVHYGAGLAVFLAATIAAYASFGWLQVTTQVVRSQDPESRMNAQQSVREDHGGPSSKRRVCRLFPSES